jgi:hypothetical protein
MSDQPRSTKAEWDRSQWASGDALNARRDAKEGRGDAVLRWSLWEWASIPRPATVADAGVGDSALSGHGHNPGVQRWGVRS